MRQQICMSRHACKGTGMASCPLHGQERFFWLPRGCQVEHVAPSSSRWGKYCMHALPACHAALWLSPGAGGVGHLSGVCTPCCLACTQPTWLPVQTGAWIGAFLLD